MPATLLRPALLLICSGTLSPLIQAQTSSPPSPPSPPASAPRPTKLDRVEITGGRANDTEQRHQSTAAKIVVGRDEIERYGDSTVGELLKRLPGVTMQGAPGRGGNIRLRGLGGGYTQILLDGQRVPPGFSIDSLTPEQIERIEILRAPTAETGARAIAGTINIITREGFKKRINDLRMGFSVENGHVQPGASWTRNDSVGAWTYNLSATAFRFNRSNDSVTTTTDQRLDDGSTTLAQSEHSLSHEHRAGLNLSSRLQWRDEKVGVLTLAPFLIHAEGRTHRDSVLTQSVPGPGIAPAPPYDHAESDTDSRLTLLRLNGQWNLRLADGSGIEWRGGIGQSTIASHALRNEFAPGSVPLRVVTDLTDIRDRSATFSGKLTKLIAAEHSLVSGAEAEAIRRAETGVTREDGIAIVDDDLQAASTRFALFAQDEWDLSPHWSAHAGLRWEGIATRGEAEGASMQRNRSSVWTPLLHALWKPDPKGRDQVRMSLTRSYRSPTLQNLIGRRQIPLRAPLHGANSPTLPDRAGNPDLLPELARGIDVAIERYLGGGGLLSANVFRRNLRNYIRSVTALENVPGEIAPRWVARPQNIGNAVTQGLELEAKFRLTEVWADAPALDLRANASFFHSRVESVPGPDNRLDQQPSATANLGADYRWRGTPLTVGGNLNWNPAYTTRVSESQTAYQGRKRVVDAYALWVFNPTVQLRVLASNVAPLDYVTGGSVDTATLRETSQTTARSYLNWQFRLEMKL